MERMQGSREWWAAIWCGLVVDPEGKHIRRLGIAGWLLVYLILHARRETGVVVTRQRTISRRTRVPIRTIQRWLSRLRRYGYVEIATDRPVLRLRVNRWKSVGAMRQR